MLILAAISVAQADGAWPEPGQADIAWIATGEFCEPETVLPLPDDTLLVSNVCDFRTAGNGYLTLIAADGKVLDWRHVDGLDSPLGMALVGDRLYVIDTNRVDIFRWPGFELLQKIQTSAAVANDIAVAEDGTMYITDTGRGEVLRISPDGTQHVLESRQAFSGANGIAIDGDNLFIGGERLWCVHLKTRSVMTIGPEWLADIDGIELEQDGTLQVTPVGGPLVRYKSDNDIDVLGGDGVSSANHGFSPSLGLALIPTGFDNTVIAIRVPVAATATPK
ncbi:MAG: hypothetical protein HKN77_09390 [Woeseiaceae bacterium]|nr:hypothetical protein [Woeseiaceae bacterium]